MIVFQEFWGLMPRKVDEDARNASRLDVTSTRQLIGYATSSMMRRLSQMGLSQGKVGEKLGFDQSEFSRRLTSGLNGSELLALDREMIKHDERYSINGGLSALDLRLRRTQDPSQVLPVPQSWTWELLNSSPRDEHGVLMQGAILLDLGRNFDNMARFKEIVERLIMIGAAPPTPRNVEALLLLGSIAGDAFDKMERWLEKALRSMPLGFRVWRTITSVIALQNPKKSPGTISSWVQLQLGRAEQLRETSLFPARSLDLEAAIAIPPKWTEHRDWVRPVLVNRARNTRAVVRERGTAAHGLWERGFREHGRPDVELREIMADLLGDFTKGARDHDDPVPGLKWVAATLEQLINDDIPVCQQWPEVDDPCLSVVTAATAHLANDPRIGRKTRKRDLDPVDATCVLLEHTLLQNAGVHRRNAIDTLLAADMAGPVVEALQVVLEHDAAEAWLRCRALFAFGMLQERGPLVRAILGHAFEQAWQRFRSKPARTTTSELHAAMFAIGDCFGAAGGEAAAEALRHDIDPIMPKLIELTGQSDKTHMAARAAAYMIMVTAHVDPPSSRELLQRLRSHPDEATRNLSDWALQHRFTEHGTRPLHAAFIMQL